MRNLDIRPIFGTPARMGAEKEDVSGETWTYHVNSNPLS